jgi:hypothetical protein
MANPDMGMVLLGPGFNVMSSLFSVDLPTLAGDAINTCCFKSLVILDGWEETEDFPW